MLDEPTVGLSPKLRRELADAIAAIRADGVPLILVDQDVDFMRRLVDVLYLFDHGAISGRMLRDEIPDHDALMTHLFGQAPS